MKKISIILAAFLLGGCAATQINENYEQILLKEDASADIRINREWWTGYGEARLNELIGLALKNNIDLAKSAIAVNKALAQAGVLQADLVPSFNANLGAETGKNIKTGGSWSESYKSGISLSYEIDLWRKLANSTDAAMWEANATKYDLEAARLALINSVADAYFEAKYQKESINLYKKTLKNYEELEAIIKAKFELGKEEELSLKQVKSSVISAKNRILNASKSLDAVEKTLRNLLNVRPEFDLNLGGNLSDISPQGVNLNVPLYVIGARPDLQAAISRIKESLLEVKVSEKSFYPSITVGAGLGGSGDSASEGLKLNFLSGNIAINLPFLNYSKLKSKLKISELEFETMKLNYAQTLTTALNEIDAGYKNLQKDEAVLRNLNENLRNLSSISDIYKLKYDYGKTELKNYLEAQNSLLEGKISALAQKYKILQDEIGIYKATAGKAE
ncbi:TolC-like outer membrane efflux protein [Campylobacter showae]|uniref:Efflux transporter, outer membrane factor lipoprotein, NodT family n=1 Tax=Campylobacter showae RM3277 TaxID=553219 RepID=C6RFF5_9BACT|nr:TolC family protein [Campylobacter showae]EET79963.1 efflux transporter, outer membrane factor lipoprotein, NodT family [Campylobacter showae RM3277]QCD48838.1 TolC-like outer membrane efflux protein [Campylobacter showae]